MPRSLRLAIARLPHHIVQRGHSRDAVFFSDADCVDYLGTLAEFRVALGLRVYAYCLMTNHVHLLVDPRDDPRSLSVLMRRLAGRHSRRLNALRGSSGSLWEGRFKCSPIDTDRYLLTCGRYIDLNPVRARLVNTPQAYRWSSYRARAGLCECPFLDLDPSLEALATLPGDRQDAYRRLATTPLTIAELDLLRGAANRNQLTGDESFAELIRRETGMDVSTRQPGRPKRGIR